MDRDELEVLSGRLLFTGWPMSSAVCPKCDSTRVRAVAFELLRGARVTVVDGEGVRLRPRDPDDEESAPPIEMRLVFQCDVHETILCIAPASGDRLSAVIYVRPRVGVRRSIWMPARQGFRAARRIARRAKPALRLVSGPPNDRRGA